MTRPSFSAAWAASQQIYDPADPAGKVAKTIGGYVEKNIRNPDSNQRWSNTCAVRMSYVLNQAGLVISRIPGQTVSGADKRQYFFRVKDLVVFLRQHWGEADEIVEYPPSGGGPLVGRKGVILFEISGWSDAQGHATLFDGSVCYDLCYFSEPEANYHTNRANFWSLS
jgi:hypothetical protein